MAFDMMKRPQMCKRGRSVDEANEKADKLSAFIDQCKVTIKHRLRTWEDDDVSMNDQEDREATCSVATEDLPWNVCTKKDWDVEYDSLADYVDQIVEQQQPKYRRRSNACKYTVPHNQWQSNWSDDDSFTDSQWQQIEAAEKRHMQQKEQEVEVIPATPYN